MLGSLNQTLATKLASKYDPAAERLVREWMAEKFVGKNEDDEAVKRELLNSDLILQELLKNGEILCK